MIVVTRMQGMAVLQGLISVSTGSGMGLFLLAWLLSTIGANLVTSSSIARVPSTSAAVAKAIARVPSLGPAITGLVLSLAGGTIVLLSPSVEDVAVVRSIRIREKPAVNINILPQPRHDLYLEVATAGKTVRTKTERRAVLGNGLTIILPQPIPFRDIRSVAAWDARTSTVWGRLHTPQQIDRVDELGLTTTGTRFQFVMGIGDEIHPARWIPLLAGDAVVGLGLICLVWASVRPILPKSGVNCQ